LSRLIVGIALALALALAAQFAWPRAGLPTAARGPAILPHRLARPPTPPAWPDLLKAPVFAPDRRPGDPQLSQGEGLGGLEGYELLGVAASPHASTAVLGGPEGSKILRPGDILAGWRLAAIGRNRAEFERHGVRRNLVVGVPAVALQDDKK
jgi:hypothetical protein